MTNAKFSLKILEMFSQISVKEMWLLLNGKNSSKDNWVIIFATGQSG